MEQLHQNSLKIVSAAGEKVPVKLRHVTMSRPEHSPIVLIYTSIVLLMIVMATMASVCEAISSTGPYLSSSLYQDKYC